MESLDYLMCRMIDIPGKMLFFRVQDTICWVEIPMCSVIQVLLSADCFLFSQVHVLSGALVVLFSVKQSHVCWVKKIHVCCRMLQLLCSAMIIWCSVHFSLCLTMKINTFKSSTVILFGWDNLLLSDTFITFSCNDMLLGALFILFSRKI
jgi:hypothetical protein